MHLCNLHEVSNGSATFRPWRCGHHHPPFWNESWGAGVSSITKWRSRLDEWSIDNHGNLKVSSTRPDLIHGICAKLVTEIGCSSQVWHGVPSTSPPAVQCRSAQSDRSDRAEGGGWLTKRSLSRVVMDEKLRNCIVSLKWIWLCLNPEQKVAENLHHQGVVPYSTKSPKKRTQRI